MKQQLLLLAASAMIVGSASAAEPLKYTNESFSRISPNGRWAVSCGFGQFRVFDLQNDDTYEPTDPTNPAEDEYTNYYPNAGYGSPVSNDGIVVGTITYSGEAAYWTRNDDDFEGTWHTLPTMSDAGSSANGITPDGSRIVGYCYPKATDYSADEVYVVPALWERNDTGGYTLVELPLIDKDFTGRTPQFIIAHSISADGKTIAAQMTTYDGYYHSPVVYTENADGTWTGTLYHSELQKGDAVFPEWTAAPKYPSIEDYMSAESYEEYSNQLEAYWTAFWAAWENGEDFEDVAPELDDFVTDDERVAYNADLAIYQQWVSDVQDPFNEVYYGLMGDDGLGIPEFLMNQVCLSQNGKYYGATKSIGDFFSGYTYEPYRFNLSTDAIDTFDAETKIDFVSSYGDMLGSIKCPDGYMCSTWICPTGSNNFTRLEEFVATKDAEAYSWLEDNATTNYYIGYNDDYTEMLTESDIMLGVPVASDDMSTIVSYRYDMLAENDDEVITSFIISLPGNAGIQEVAAGNASDVKISTTIGGTITISGKAASLDVYDMSGRNVFTASAPQGIINTALPAGAYIIKAVSTSGNTTVVKAQF
jgi:hypothetical protein